MHMPYCHLDTWRFLSAIKKRYRPDRVICLGDEIDGHALSYHESDPDLDSAGPELEKAIKFLRPLYRMFPVVDVLESNHGSLIYRKAKTAGIPKRSLKSYRDNLEAPHGWRWHFEMRLQMSDGNWLYLHHGKSSRPGELSRDEGSSAVQGHFHTKFQVTYRRTHSGLYFDMHCGYLADHDGLAMAYDKGNPKKGIVGAAVILNGRPLMLPMRMNARGRWTGHL